MSQGLPAIALLLAFAVRCLSDELPKEKAQFLAKDPERLLASLASIKDPLDVFTSTDWKVLVTEAEQMKGKLLSLLTTSSDRKEQGRILLVLAAGKFEKDEVIEQVARWFLGNEVYRSDVKLVENALMLFTQAKPARARVILRDYLDAKDFEIFTAAFDAMCRIWEREDLKILRERLEKMERGNEKHARFTYFWAKLSELEKRIETRKDKVPPALIGLITGSELFGRDYPVAEKRYPGFERQLPGGLKDAEHPRIKLMLGAWTAWGLVNRKWDNETRAACIDALIEVHKKMNKQDQGSLLLSTLGISEPKWIEHASSFLKTDDARLVGTAAWVLGDGGARQHLPAMKDALKRLEAMKIDDQEALQSEIRVVKFAIEKLSK